MSRRRFRGAYGRRHAARRPVQRPVRATPGPVAGQGKITPRRSMAPVWALERLCWGFTAAVHEPQAPGGRALRALWAYTADRACAEARGALGLLSRPRPYWAAPADVDHPFPASLVCLCGCTGDQHSVDHLKHRTRCAEHGGHKLAPVGRVAAAAGPAPR